MAVPHVRLPSTLGGEIDRAQTTEEQGEFAAREHLPYPLLADPGLRLAESMRFQPSIPVV